MNADTPDPQIVTFYSYKGGSGRTMAVANLAWILASNGLRVLAVDWDLESPGLHRYFHPFLRDKDLRSTTGVIDLVRDYASEIMRPELDITPDWLAKQTRVLRHAISLDWPFPDRGSVDFLCAGRQDRLYSQTVSTFDWANFFERLGGADFLESLRTDMRRNYDFVLIDSRTGLSDAAGICTVVLPDVVVDCFAMSTQSIDGAAAVARSVRGQRQDGQPIRILPVPMRVEDAEKFKLEAGREYARKQFAPFLTDLPLDRIEEYWGNVEIPYKTFYAYEEILTPFGDVAHDHTSLLAAFERLAAVVTDGRVTQATSIPEPERRRFLAEFERMRSPIAADVLISYASVDRMWAEWISGELVDGGLTVHLQAVDSVTTAAAITELERDVSRASRIIVLVSNDYAKVPSAPNLWKLASAQETGALPRLMVPIRLDTMRLPAPFNEPLGIELSVLSEDRARAALQTTFNLAPGSARTDGRPGTDRPRFPSSPPPIWRVPPRNATFTGRGTTLERVRNGLAATPTVVVPQTLFGLGGVGKTQVALEYAHRFAANYDIVWWISAEERSTARSDLFDLANALGMAKESSTADSIRDVLEALRKGHPYQRWLLIYDNADTPEQVQDLIPQGTGHVLLTSRNVAWAGQATEAVELGVFDRAESVAFLRRQVAALSEEDADLLADSLGDLPLAVEQAAAWLSVTGMDVRRYVELLETEPTALLDQNQASNYPHTATATWQVSLRRLREQMPAAAKALEVCAFFAPEPIPLSLLSHERFLAILTPFDESLRLPVMEGRLAREIVRFALARVDRGRNSIVIHRLVQLIIRGQLTEEQADETRMQAHEVLAAANPVTTDDPNRWPAFAELWPHLRIRGLFESPSIHVRQLIVDMVRYRYRRYDFPSSAELAETVVAKWTELFGPDDLVTLHLRFHLANALRSQARYHESLAIDEDVLARLRVAPDAGPNHPYTLMAAGGLAADRRALGDFGLARDLDVDTAARYREAFGEDHYRALMAANNLAVSHRMVGEYRAATELDLDTYNRRRNILGERHPYTLFSASNYGSDLREIGDFNGSKALLESTLLICREVIGEDQTDTLRTARNLVVTLRRLGEFAAAHELGLDTLERYERALGPEHTDTMLCEMTVASTYAGIGDDEHARDMAQATLDHIRRVLNEEHVLTKVCRHNLTIYQLKLDGAQEALPLATSVYERFRDTLGENHPYTLNAALNVANVHWALDNTAAARAIDEDAYERFRETLGDDHPDTLNAAVNLAVSLAGTDPQFDQLVAERLRVFADRHPRIQAIRPGVRINSYIEPPSP